MTKKSLNKLLSVVLTLAICFTTVFGCLITVNAAGECCYKWSKGEIAIDKKSATIDLTFTAPTGLTKGIGAIEFELVEVLPMKGDWLVLDEENTKVVKATYKDKTTASDISDINFSVAASDSTKTNTVAAVVDTSNAYDSITLRFAFTLSGKRTSGDYRVKATNIIISDPFKYDEPHIHEATDEGVIKVGCSHVIAVTGDPINVDTVNGYSVYESSFCTICGETFGHQIVPTAEALPDNPTDVVNTIYWDRSVAEGFEEGFGTKESPYIIKTAAELAYLVDLKADKTEGKYFKIDDGITNIVLQKEAYADEIIALSSAAAVKEYFENVEYVNQWVINGNETAAFCGTFDGNGATIYGLYTEATHNAGLFSTVDAGATIKNIAIKNSYFKTTVDNYHMGAIASFASGTGEKTVGVKNNGMIWINNCTVANCYMRSVSTSIERSGIMFGNAPSDVLSIDNCLVYGNDGYYGANYENKMPLIAYASNTVAEEGAIIPEDLTYLAKGENPKRLRSVVRNSIILDCDVMNTSLTKLFNLNHPGCYSNVYTNGKSGNVDFSNGKYEYLEANIKAIAAADAQGAVAETNLALAWGTEWVCGAEGQYPAQAIFAAVANTNATSTPEYVLYGSNVSYNNDGSFNLNLHFIPPYKGFAPELYVGNTDGTKFFKLTPAESCFESELGEGALMYTISNLSARDIETVWLPTLVVKAGAVTKWGMSQQIAISDNANAILAGEYDAADKRVASAVISYGKASEAALSATNPQDELNVVYMESNKEDSSVLEGHKGDAADPYIISNYGHWRYLAQSATFEQTNGKYFKVDDKIDMFVFQKKSYIESVAGSLNKFLALDANGVKKALSNEDGRTKHNNNHQDKENKNNIFAGTIDGNGVKIVGSYSAYSGLFYNVAEGATFKNIELSHNYSDLTGGYATVGGNLIATIVSNSASETNIGTVALENIIVHNNYQTPKSKYLPQSGVLVGTVVDPFVRLEYRNILTYDNIILAQDSETDATITDCALVGQFNNDWRGELYSTTNGSYRDSIFLDCVPYPTTQTNQGTKPKYWSNVYTTKLTVFTPSSYGSESNWDDYDITKLESVDSAKGPAAMTNMSDLDWINTWVVTSGYPTFISDEYNPTLQNKTVYWSGDQGKENDMNKVNDTNASGTSWDDPIIIDNAEELYFVLCKTGWANTAGKFFKVADGIGRFVLQPKGVLDLEKLIACEDGTAVKEYYETLDPSTLKQWSSESAIFDGNFDGNGVEIIGLYDVSSNCAGFMSRLDGGAPNTTDNTGITIKNTVVKNSYLISEQNLGVFGADVSTDGNGAKVKGTINLDTCAVINCYMKQTDYSLNDDTDGKYNRGAVVTGYCNDEVVKMNNMLVYGNDATDKDDNKLWLKGNALNSRKSDPNDPTSLINNTITNSILLGVDPFYGGQQIYRLTQPVCFTNLYTDENNLPKKDGEFTANFAYTDAQVKVISAVDIMGAKAQTIVDKLNTENDPDVWYAGGLDDMPSFKPIMYEMPWSIRDIYDVIEIDTYDDYADSTNQFGVYATALSLKANPYISFAFAFDKEYKTNRGKIKVKFTYTVNGTDYITTEPPIAVPAYVEGEELKNVNGWTNVANSGRYHTYKATGIPVEALANSITVKASYDDGEYVNFGAFGVEGLALDFENANKVTPSEYYETRIEAARAFLFYVKMVNARYDSVQ